MKTTNLAKVFVLFLLIICFVGCSNNSKPLSKDFDDVLSQSVQEYEIGNNSIVECEPIDPKEILEEFGDLLLLSGSWNESSEIPVEKLVMWYGYRIQKDQNISKYMRKELDGLYIPESEFENIIYNYFGLFPKDLRTNYTYNKAAKVYITPTALYDLAKIEYEIIKTDYNYGLLTIYFSLIIESREPEKHVLSAKITPDQILFVSYC